MVVNEKTRVVERKNFVRPNMMLAYSIVTVRHSEENSLAKFEEKEKGDVIMSLNVLPSEESDVIGTFITISEIWLDDKRLDGYVKQTVELSAYQEGDIKLLFNGSIKANTFKNITLVLDYQTDDSGEYPGCYLEAENNRKKQLSAIGNENIIKLEKTIKVVPEKSTEVILQIDLEKMVNYKFQPANNDVWDVESIADQTEPFKVVLKEECAIVKGEIKRLNCSGANVYILAYKKEEIGMLENCFDPEQFPTLIKNATAGSKVKPYGGFQLSILKPGNYEFHMVSLNKKYNRVFRFKGIVNSTSNVHGVMLKNIEVRANSQLQLNIDIIGVI